MDSESSKPTNVGSNDQLGGSASKCACGDRPADACTGEWEPGCDLGANEKFARAHEQTYEEQAALTRALALPPTPGSRWTTNSWPHGTVARVMGVVEGWVVWRRKGCAPQLRHVGQWHDGFTLAPPLRPKKTPNVRGEPTKEAAP